MSAEPPVTEPAPAPEVFVEGFEGVSVAGGVAKFPFFSVIQGADGQPERRIVARLAMPLGTVVGAHQALSNLIAQLKEQGMLVEQG